MVVLRLKFLFFIVLGVMLYAAQECQGYCTSCSSTPCKNTRAVARYVPYKHVKRGWWWSSGRTTVTWRYKTVYETAVKYECCRGYVSANGKCHRGSNELLYCGKVNGSPNTYAGSSDDNGDDIESTDDSMKSTAVPKTPTDADKNSTFTQRGGSRYIVGGQFASQNQFPWMVSLRRYGSLFCGGSIISKRYILTAAHCVDDKTASSIKVYAGDHYLSYTESSQRIYSVSQITMHSYDSDNHKNDIALLKLATDIDIDSDRFPVCLPDDSEAHTKSVAHPWYIMGWGHTSSGGSTSNTLKYAKVQSAGSSTCRNTYKTFHEYGVCVTDGSGDDDDSSCHGDSGGPLVYKAENGRSGTYSYHIIGVASYVSGRGCAAGRPFVYNAVGPYLEWIYRYI